MIATIFLALSAWALAPSDPVLEAALQGDVLAGRLAQGESPEQACAAISRYFGRDCRYSDGVALITSGSGVGITYLATINLTTEFP